MSPTFEIKTGPFLRDSSVRNFHIFLKISLSILRVAQNPSFPPLFGDKLPCFIFKNDATAVMRRTPAWNCLSGLPRPHMCLYPSPYISDRFKADSVYTLFLLVTAYEIMIQDLIS